jgi:chemotaxis protein methyltransferase CheR
MSVEDWSIIGNPKLAQRIMATNYDLDSRIESLRPWIESETGMTFSGNRFSRLRSSVEKVLGDKKGPIQSELDLILSKPRHRSVFLERLMAEVTIGESFFFRNENHFRALRERVIPSILDDNAQDKEIRIWSAGCAGGEEAYSMAILLDQMLMALPQWKVHILATDLNAEFLDRARQARYRQWSFRQTDINHDRNYFSVEGKDFCLAPRIRQHVRFAYLNLVKDVYPSPLTGTLGLDLILFRNVAIYLKPEVTKAIIQRFHRALRPGGWLLLGETEVGTAPSEGFEVHRFDDSTLFRRTTDRGPISDDAVPMPTPPLATAIQRPAVHGTRNVPAPDWLPLPKPKRVSTPRLATSAADQVHRLLQQRKFAEAERTIDRIATTKDRAAERLRYVRGLLAVAEITRAREMLDKCLGEEPLLVEAQLLKATFAEEDGDLAEAEQAYRRALYIDRKCTIAHFHLALFQQQAGDVHAARRSLAIALELARDEDVHEAVPHGDGVCFGRLREMAEAILNDD